MGHAVPQGPILALDSAQGDVSAAVVTGGAVRALASAQATRAAAERLPDLAAEALTAAGLTLSGIAAIAVTVGPGGFSGIRTAVAFARGLALPHGVAVIGIGTLDALHAAAWVQAPGEPGTVAFDARRGEVYVQAFDGGGAPFSDPRAVPPEDAARALAVHQPGGFVAGTGAPLIAAALAATGGDPARFTWRADVSYDAGHVGLCAALRPGAHRAPDPLYLRAPDATLPA
ncbi:tRNA (adenosine(37)-N6)-threonylcarbamoyltransferase complex dimerization subunit type 1 TsaB [Futiania mangrovi]|uniref:tRNA (Adenosine(37)-N6)-threonylcarbamoyltransferase complex dimerization subunit type 1 TsaB n=1 Tax=Futiania mangrovi TaxID=2959716 RepID=A0A9J6PDI5_9PROT|nr:tRNA (adenosine(37)-N6)-threonylcarbamoyltransferase complex dimerization subunit type 1 TsaB [Futiania mangrovii]MCP1336414.1 tRNA (adenosine(37)-N6)-threonylcarbamoyltransferase complex dimerization subunit type 1 TsaB [Futiania mangrovii]